MTIPFSGTLLTVPNSCAPRHGPFVVGSGVRFLRVFANADNPGQDILLRLYRDAALVATSPDVGFTPEAIQYSPTGGVPPGNYFAEVCVFGTPLEPRTYTGTFTIDDTPAPHPYLARWQVFPANPPLATILGDPWGNPSTDTRELWCWDAGEAADCDKVVGNLASRAPWDHNVRANAPTLTTIGNNAVTATSWAHPFVTSPPGYRPTSPSRDYLYPWTNDWNLGDCEPTPGAPGATWDDSAAVTNLFVAHNRMHDFAYFLGFTERNWNAQDINFGLTETWRENDPVVGNAQAGVLAGARDNANMFPMPEGLTAFTNMYMWQSAAGRLLRALRRRRLRHGRHRPRVRAPDREPHDRQGQLPHRAPRRGDGREPRRPDGDGVPERERLRPDRRREPLRRRDVRDRQQGAGRSATTG